MLKFQRSRLSTVICVITGNCIIRMHASRIDLGYLANDFCRSCGDEEEDETVLYLLCTCAALDRKRMSHLVAINMEDLNELPCMEIGNLTRFIESSGCFLDRAEYETVVTQWVLCVA